MVSRQASAVRRSKPSRRQPKDGGGWNFRSPSFLVEGKHAATAPEFARSQSLEQTCLHYVFCTVSARGVGTLCCLHHCYGQDQTLVGQLRPATGRGKREMKAVDHSLRGARVLVAEDDAILALDVRFVAYSEFGRRLESEQERGHRPRARRRDDHHGPAASRAAASSGLGRALRKRRWKSASIPL